MRGFLGFTRILANPATAGSPAFWRMRLQQARSRIRQNAGFFVVHPHSGECGYSMRLQQVHPHSGECGYSRPVAAFARMGGFLGFTRILANAATAGCESFTLV